MKILVLFAGLVCALCLFTVVKAYPMDDVAAKAEHGSVVADLNVENDAPLGSLNRQKRFTCDFLENNPACAFHCWLKGKSGGYCNSKKVCICR
ncbi:PREDICTED: tenecin-1-like [Bactrocera latifrons]|uniref:tenecin-1-like n=1 Tax=Bactrocera latifrons TaxID=174628 RepID=UPI0008DE864E|nr:PREDICTED: tenecin-1-like [Bactrocera latifrons]